MKPNEQNRTWKQTKGVDDLKCDEQDQLGEQIRGVSDPNFDDDIDIKFATQMEAARVTPQHRIAIAVSGGADSMALCLLLARWKKMAEDAGEKCAGLIGFVVDHSLRSGSAEEAVLVKQRVRKLGFRCEILTCVWADPVPSLGHLQESARHARYTLLAQACQVADAQILLTAHHADDQAELFILRLSRCSGIAGLAGMASATHLNPVMQSYLLKNGVPFSLLLIRPLLRFVKEDLYQICQNSGQSWVEDPTNRNLSFARNRIRKALRGRPLMAIRGEIQELISLSRRTRSMLDRNRDRLLSEVAQVSQEWGYVTIDIEKLFSSGANDAVLHRTVEAILQFVAQRVMPPRKRATMSVLDHLSTKFSKGAYTAGGCNVFPAPGSKGRKAIICYSPDSPPPSAHGEVYLDWHKQGLLNDESTPFSNTPSFGHGDLCSGEDSPALADVHSSATLEAISSLTLGARTPTAAVNGFRNLRLLSETGADLLCDLVSEAAKDMSKKPDKQSEETSRGKRKGRPRSTVPFEKTVSFGESEYFTNRFVVALCTKEEEIPATNTQLSSVEGDEATAGHCFIVRQQPRLWIRHWDEEADLEYISRICKQPLDLDCIEAACNLSFEPTSNVRSSKHCQPPSLRRDCSAPPSMHHPQEARPKHIRYLIDDFSVTVHQSVQAPGPPSNVVDQISDDEPRNMGTCKKQCCGIVRVVKAKEALLRLQSIPKFVRRSLPVLVTAQGLLCGIPCVSYWHCPLVSMTALFRPRSPLGGGKSLWH